MKISRTLTFSVDAYRQYIRSVSRNMKISRTLTFMLLNPIPFLVLLTCGFSFAAYVVVAEESFIYGTWPEVVEITTPPESIGAFAKAASMLLGKIIEEFTQFGVWLLILVMLVFTISYREARGNLKGIAREQHIWMRWYHQHKETIAQGNTPEASPRASENRKVNSYFRKTLRTLITLVRKPMPLIVHFACWLPAFTLLLFILMAEAHTASEFVMGLQYTAIPSLILAVLSSYQETRGTVKGTAKVRQAWTQWHQQQEAQTQGIRFDARGGPPVFDTSG